MAKRIATIVLSVLMLGAVAGVFYLTNTDNASTWYVQVDDTVAQDKSDGDEEVWEYTLDAYNERGEHRRLTFTAGKRLRDDARADAECRTRAADLDGQPTRRSHLRPIGKDGRIPGVRQSR